MKKLLLIISAFLIAIGVQAQGLRADAIKIKTEIDDVINITKEISMAGDLIKQSGYLRISGFAVGIGASTLLAAGVFKNDPETQRNFAIVSLVTGISLYISGELKLIEAGKIMNNNAVTVSASKNGFGLAINF